MTKANSSHIIYPKVKHVKVNKNYKAFLKRHGYKTIVTGIVPREKIYDKNNM